MERGKIYESLVISRLNVKRYWRERGREVNGLIERVSELIPLKVKASADWSDDYASNIKRFMSKFGAKKGVIIYSGKNLDLGTIKAVSIHHISLLWNIGSVRLVHKPCTCWPPKDAQLPFYLYLHHGVLALYR